MKFLDHSLAKIAESRQETLIEKDLENLHSKITDILDPMFRSITSHRKAATAEKSEEK